MSAVPALPRALTGALGTYPHPHPPQLLRNERPTWVPMLEIITDLLEQRAETLDLTAAPQPYKVAGTRHRVEILHTPHAALV